MVLLPQGKIINNPDSVKLIKVVPTTLGKKSFFVVTLKLDDDSELMIDRCATSMEAETLADSCRRLLNGEEHEEVPSFVDEASENSDHNQSIDSNVVEEESSDFEFSEDEAADLQPATTFEEESSSFAFSSDEEKAEEVKPVKKTKKQTKKTQKPKIQEPYTEEPTKSATVKKSKTSVTSKKSKATPKVESNTTESVSSNPVVPEPQVIPRVTNFIEGDSDEWIPDNGLDDWYDE